MNLIVPRKVLLIQGRNFGDSVIVTGLLEALGRSVNDIEISVLTRPHFKEIYERNPFVTHIEYANFPMGTDKRFGGREALNLIRKLAKSAEAIAGPGLYGHDFRRGQRARADIARSRHRFRGWS